jgi:hypothetical protein
MQGAWEDFEITNFLWKNLKLRDHLTNMYAEEKLKLNLMCSMSVHYIIQKH